MITMKVKDIKSFDDLHALSGAYKIELITVNISRR